MKSVILIAALVFGCLAVTVVAQEDMPEAPGKAMTLRYCTQCHQSDTFSSNRNSGNGWDQTMATMTDKGINWASDADYATVLDYLSSCLGPVSKKVNVNKAAACELVRMLGISNEQADALVAYRTKNGDFKDLDGVKKVEGVDSAALDSKKTPSRFD